MTRFLSKESRQMVKSIMIAALLFISALPVSWADQELHQRPRYMLHAGDVITLDYRYTPEFNQTVTIQPDGYVSLDIVGEVKVSGLTLEEAHDQIATAASSRLNHPELTLTLKDFQRPYIVVAGEVVRPG